ncbi:hypothetical protein EMPS_03304 [Entomortierella parvispora]|uniref:FAD-binding PCMH-type domain-containing protein n=1 Tax=Entomortierella parvispora TaxID=205924 RepID=A0A9P3H6J0_9FUNG|nr:hypothetical protein EMPS_03304 [Entomortierella parvispora]
MHFLGSVTVLLTISQLLLSTSVSAAPTHDNSTSIHFSSFSASTATGITPSQKLLSCLSSLTPSKVLTSANKATSASFQQNRYGFDLRYDYIPQVIVMAANVQDVQTAVKCAAAAQIPIAPRSGGHSFEGYSIGGQNGSMVIDLTAMSAVQVVKGSGSNPTVAKVGAGIRLGKLYLDLFNQGGWTLNGGTCPSVGIGGHALGGGFGLLARKYGLIADRIVEMQVVNAKGQILTASATQNQDLFYALRGAGGGSFAVVTQFTFLPIKPASKVTSFSYSWKASDGPKVFKAYTEQLYKATRDLGVELNWGPSGPELMGIFQGTKAKQSSALAAFFKAVPKPKSSDVRESRYVDAQLRFAWIEGGSDSGTNINALALTGKYHTGDSRYTKGKSMIYSSAMKDSTISIVQKWTSQKPKGATANYVIADVWGGAVQDTPVDATSFVHRQAQTVFELVVEWDQSANPKPGKPDCQPCLQWINDFHAALVKDYNANYKAPLSGYQNYIDIDMPNWLNAYYGSATPRLKQIKSSIDPQNVFRFPQSIPLQ